MIKSLSILYYIRKEKIDSNGCVPIYCRITIDGGRTAFSIHRKVLYQKWDTGKCKVNGNTVDAKTINSYLSLLDTKIYEAQLKLVSMNKIVTANAVKSLVIDRPERKAVSLFKVFEDHNTKMKSLVGSEFAYGTYERFRACINHLRIFVKDKYKSDDIRLHEVNHEFITEFDYYLRAVGKCANNTTVKYIKNLGKIIRIALAHGWIQTDPFINHKVRLEKVDRGYLTTDELNMIVQKNIDIPRLANVRDVFLFQCYTGLAYIDVKQLKKQHLSCDAQGTFWIKTKRLKTGNTVNVPLLPQAVLVLQKHKEYSSQNAEGYLMPVPSNQRTNAYLKEIQDLCGISKKLSSHIARHTFATTITLNNGVSLEVVSKMLGHSSVNTTRIYARMLDTRVSHEMQQLTSKLQQDFVANVDK
jgi:integrase